MFAKTEDGKNFNSEKKNDPFRFGHRRINNTMQYYYDRYLTSITTSSIACHNVYQTMFVEVFSW